MFQSLQPYAVSAVWGSEPQPDMSGETGKERRLPHSMKTFEPYRPEDIVLDPTAYGRFRAILNRLSRIQSTVGYGNFCLLNFDEMRQVASSYPSVGEFPGIELDHLEKLFYQDAKQYGFNGEKTLHHLTDPIDKRLVLKIKGTGNYLYKGMSIDMYRRLSEDIGPQLVLTSGIRGIAKQYYLFLSKALNNRGNLSFAARSIAPPGYSFHIAGDFDVGKAGFGIANFTRRFTQTDIYARLNSLDYVTFRYPPGNPTGVMFEPWHIQVV